MPDPGGDFFADLTTAPIFDEGVYLSEALLLPINESEDDVDAQLASAARESGIEDPYRYLFPDVHGISASMSTRSLQSEQRSSTSLHSQETQSTGFTSQPSRTSRDHAQHDRSPALRTAAPIPRASLSLDQDSVSDRSQPSMRHRHSSAYSAANSTVSNTSSARKPTIRKHLRGSGLFSIFRKDSSTCPSRSHRGHHTKPQSPKLECGHSLSKHAIRVHIEEAMESEEQVAPTCCGHLLPREVLETVLTGEEVDIVINSALQSPNSQSLRDSGYSENDVSSIDLASTLNALSTANVPSTLDWDINNENETDRISALANEAFKSLKAEQRDQFQRVSWFESNQRKALLSHHRWALKKLSSHLEATKSDRTKQHPLELESLDELQITAEHELRKAHAIETQNVATALKYIEAYCTALNPACPDLAHVVTDEDRAKLDRQHTIQQKLPAKQESEINVLRAKQERYAQVKRQKQKAELQQLDAEYEKEKRAQELQHVRNTGRLDAFIQSRRRRIMHRWDLKFEIWGKDWETQHGITFSGRLSHEDWPESMELEDPIHPSSALSVYTQILG